MDTKTRARIEALLQKKISSWQSASGGYTPAERWVVSFEGASSCFAKIGTTPLTAGWLRREAHWYQRISGDFMPRFYGFEDDAERPLLLLEDLSDAHWPTIWEAHHIELLRETMERVASTRPLPEDLIPLEKARASLSGWSQIARDPAPFLSLGLCSASWLERALPVLQKAQDETPLEGEDLIHFDLRSDNLCFQSKRVVLVDWNGPARGNRLFDLAAIASCMRAEGGPLPEEWSSESAPFAALIAGYFAANAGLPQIPNAPRVRWIQLRQLRQALPWVIRVLGLPPLDLHWARAEGHKIESRFQSNEINEAQRQEQHEEILIDAYLSSDDPRQQSGKSGDETEWRWSRELILDALPDGGNVLDVGAANGYLMESLHRWGVARGVQVAPYGLEISARMASLARRRLPQWAERIWVGDVLSWQSPMRFDLVHLGLDYVIASRQREMIERVRRDWLLPGGRIVIRPERVTDEDIPAKLKALGLSMGGVIERRHPHTNVIRRTVWL